MTWDISVVQMTWDIENVSTVVARDPERWGRQQNFRNTPEIAHTTSSWSSSRGQYNGQKWFPMVVIILDFEKPDIWSRFSHPAIPRCVGHMAQTA